MAEIERNGLVRALECWMNRPEGNLLELPSKDRLEIGPSKEELNNKRDYKQMHNSKRKFTQKFFLLHLMPFLSLNFLNQINLLAT